MVHERADRTTRRGRKREKTPDPSTSEEEEVSYESADYEDEEVEEGESTEEEYGNGLSLLESHIVYAETALSTLSEEISRVRLLRDKLQQIRHSGLFTKGEIRDYEKSFEHYRSKLSKGLGSINTSVEKSKKLWEEKQAFMSNLYVEGALDDVVAERWQKSLDHLEDRISKLNLITDFQSSH